MNSKLVPSLALLILAVAALACGGGRVEAPAPPTPAPPTATSAPPTPTPMPPTPTPMPPTPTPEPTPVAEPGWHIYTNGNQVRHIALHDGRIWAATGGGVVVWDKASGEASLYTTLDGLPTNDIRSIAVCAIPETRIIAGTEYGLSLYDSATDTWKLMTPDNSGMKMRNVKSLACGPGDNTLTIGYSWGVDIFHADTGEWQYLDGDSGLASNWVSRVAVAGDEVWVTSPTGVSVIHADGSVTPYKEDEGDIPDENVAAIAGDGEGNVWLAALDGLIKFREGSWTVYNRDNVESFTSYDSLIGVAVAPDGTVWAGNMFGDLCQFDSQAESCLATYKEEPGMLDNLQGLVIDDQGRVYCYDDKEGISMFDGSNWHPFLLDPLPVSNSYKAIAQLPDGVIVVGGLFGFQRFSAYEADASWEHNDMEGYGVNVFHLTSEGFWVGHGAGASFYEYESEKWTHLRKAKEAGEGIYRGSVTAIAVDGSGRVWFGTPNGLTVWDGETFTYHDLLNAEELAEEKRPRQVYALLFDGSNMWVGAYAALFRFDENGEMTRWDEELPGIIATFTLQPRALALDPEGNVLLGIGQRLFRYDAKKETFSEVMEVDDAIYSILATDAGEIWLGLYEDGIAHYDGDDWSLLTTLDGYSLPSNRFKGQSILMDDVGTIWFAGGEGGLARYVP